MGRWRRRSQDEQGTVLVVVAVAMATLIGSTTLAVDIGRLTLVNRHSEATADVVALDAARAIDGHSSVSQLGGTTGAVTLAAQASASRNNTPYSELKVELGSVSTGTFVAQDPAVTPNAVPDTVRVTDGGKIKFAFAPGYGGGNRTASGPCGAPCTVVTKESITGISVGSFLVRVSTSTGLLNSILPRFLGTSADLTLVGYTGIAAGYVNLGELRAQLAFGTVDQLLSTNVTVKNLLDATAAALNARGDAASLTARTAVMTISSATNSSLSLKLSDLIAVAQGDGQSAASADINVLQLIEMAAEVANGTNALALTLSPGSLGGLGALLNAGGNSLSLKVIEPPQIAIGPARKDAAGNWMTSVHTAQVRLMVHLRPLGTVLGGILDLPIYLEAASATASVRGITCATPLDSSTVNVHTDAQAVRARVGTLSDINAANPTLTDATILNVLGVVSVTGKADVSVAGSSTDLTFHPGPFNWSNTQSVGSPLALGGLIRAQPLDLTLHALGLGLGLGGVLTSVLALLNPILTAVDDALLDPVLSGLGVGLSLGGGDVTDWMLRCDVLRLVG